MVHDLVQLRVDQLIDREQGVLDLALVELSGAAVDVEHDRREPGEEALLVPRRRRSRWSTRGCP